MKGRRRPPRKDEDLEADVGEHSTDQERFLLDEWVASYKGQVSVWWVVLQTFDVDVTFYSVTVYLPKSTSIDRAGGGVSNVCNRALLIVVTTQMRR